jgi:hypothetical protein
MVLSKMQEPPNTGLHMEMAKKYPIHMTVLETKKVSHYHMSQITDPAIFFFFFFIQSLLLPLGQTNW